MDLVYITAINENTKVEAIYKNFVALSNFNFMYNFIKLNERNYYLLKYYNESEYILMGMEHNKEYFINDFHHLLNILGIDERIKIGKRKRDTYDDIEFKSWNYKAMPFEEKQMLEKLYVILENVIY